MLLFVLPAGLVIEGNGDIQDLLQAEDARLDTFFFIRSCLMRNFKKFIQRNVVDARPPVNYDRIIPFK